MPTFKVEYWREDLKKQGVRTIEANDFEAAIRLAPTQGWVVRSIEQWNPLSPSHSPLFGYLDLVPGRVAFYGGIASVALTFGLLTLRTASSVPIMPFAFGAVIAVFALTMFALRVRRSRHNSVDAMNAAIRKRPAWTPQPREARLLRYVVAPYLLLSTLILPLLLVGFSSTADLQVAMRFLGISWLPVWIAWLGYHALKVRLDAPEATDTAEMPPGLAV